MQVRVLFFDLFPELRKRIEVRRVARQLIDLKPRGVLRKEGAQGGAGVIARAILNQHQGFGRLRQHVREKRLIAGAVEFAGRALVEEAPREVMD